jgi:hypothetical protein
MANGPGLVSSRSSWLVFLVSTAVQPEPHTCIQKTSGKDIQLYIQSDIQPVL